MVLWACFGHKAVATSSTDEVERTSSSHDYVVPNTRQWDISKVLSANHSATAPCHTPSAHQCAKGAAKLSRISVAIAAVLDGCGVCSDGLPLLSLAAHRVELQQLPFPAVVLSLNPLTAAAGGGGGTRRIGASLMPRVEHVNPAALSFFHLQHSEGFEALLQLQLSNDTALADMLAGAHRQPLSSHVVTVPSSPWQASMKIYVQAARCRVTGGVSSSLSLDHFADPSRSAPARPGLLLSYSPFDEDGAVCNSRLSGCSTGDSATLASAADMHLDTFLMTHIRCPVSLFSLDGRIIYQNQASKDYLGHVVRDSDSHKGPLHASQYGRMSSAEFSASHADGLKVLATTMSGTGQCSDLHRLFRLDYAALDDLHQAFKAGEDWEGTVQLPAAGHVFSTRAVYHTSNGSDAGDDHDDHYSGSVHPQQQQQRWQDVVHDVATGDVPAPPGAVDHSREALSLVGPSPTMALRGDLAGVIMFGDAATADGGAQPASVGHHRPSRVDLARGSGSVGRSRSAVNGVLAAARPTSGELRASSSSSRRHVSLAVGSSPLHSYHSTAATLTTSGGGAKSPDASQRLAPRRVNSVGVLVAAGEGGGGQDGGVDTLDRTTTSDIELSPLNRQPSRMFRRFTTLQNGGGLPHHDGNGGGGGEGEGGGNHGSSLTSSASDAQRGDKLGASKRRTQLLARTLSIKIAAAHGGRGSDGSLLSPGPSPAPSAFAAPPPTPFSPAASNKPVWHEVVAKLVRDPVRKQDVILLTMTDVDSKVQSEQHAATLLEAEHAILEQLFPRHVIEHMATMNTMQILHSSEEPEGKLAGGLVKSAEGHGAKASATSMIGQIRKQQSAFSTSHEQVTIMFADIVGFTTMCKSIPPAEVMEFLNNLYSPFDELVSIFKVYKVETAGDCYIVAGGLMCKDEDGYTSVRTGVDPLHAVYVLEFAKAMLRASKKVLDPVSRQPIQMRIGIHSGPVVSGVVGTKMPRFCLFGDTMNTAQRMESLSRPGEIHVSEPTQRLLPNECWEATMGVEIKGLGVRPTFFWVPPPSRSMLRMARKGGSICEDRSSAAARTPMHSSRGGSAGGSNRDDVSGGGGGSDGSDSDDVASDDDAVAARAAALITVGGPKPAIVSAGAGPTKKYRRVVRIMSVTSMGV